MSIFDRAKTPEQSAKERADMLEDQAREAEPALLARADGLRAEYVAEHERQVAGYSFDCKRFGDFLTLYIKRMGNPEKPAYVTDNYNSGLPIRVFSTTINLGLTLGITLVAGHGPDDAAQIGYYVRTDYDTKPYTETVVPNVMGAPYDRSLFYLPEPVPPNQNSFQGTWSSDRRGIQYKTENFPQAAKDDEIKFAGLNATIFVPAGLGDAVYERIQRELAR